MIVQEGGRGGVDDVVADVSEARCDWSKGARVCSNQLGAGGQGIHVHNRSSCCSWVEGVGLGGERSIQKEHRIVALLFKGEDGLVFMVWLSAATQ